MSSKWTDNKLDNQLFEEVSKKNPDEGKIRELIEFGANINAVERMGSSVLVTALSNSNGLDISIIQLIIDLGADLHNDNEGYTCLFRASVSQRPDLVELLLIAGANPNGVFIDRSGSLLDWAEFDLFFETSQNKGGKEPTEKIVQLLKGFGAKTISDLCADTPEKFINVYAGFNPTGLHTLKGYLKPEHIPNADKDFIEEMTKWFSTNPTNWSVNEDSGSKAMVPPDLSRLKLYNKQGLKLAEQIRKMVNPDIEVKFYFVKPNNPKRNGVYNIDYITIVEHS